MNTPIVLIPGYLLNQDIWRDVIAAMPEREAIVPDLAAFDSVEAMAEHLLITLPSRFALGGLSLGGYVAMEMASRAPERIAQLAIVNSKPIPDAPATLERRVRLRAMAENGQLAEAQRALEPLMLMDRHRTDGAEAIARLRAMYARTDACEFVRHQNALNTRPDHTEALASFAMPTLVLASRKDALVPLDVTLEMVRRLPDTRAIMLENTAHLSLLERPRETAGYLSAFFRGCEA